MKRIVKTLIALGLTLCLAICLCSCVDLDELKNSRAVYTSAAHDKLEFQGKIYKRMDVYLPNHLTPSGLDETAYAVEQDVPLLLIENIGDSVWYNKDDVKILHRGYGDYYYCREDLYDYAVNLLEENVFDYYCANLYDSETGEYHIQMLDKSLIDTVDKIIYSVEPLSEYPETYSQVSVMATDKEAMFMHDIFYVEYLVDGGYFISMENLADDIYGYVVPKEYEEEFDILFPEETKIDSYSEGVYENPEHFDSQFIF